MTRPDLDAILPPVSAEDEATVDALLAKAREGVGKRPIGGRPDLDAIRARLWSANTPAYKFADDVATLLRYIDELERRTTYTIGETEWAQRIAALEHMLAEERENVDTLRARVAELEAEVAVLEPRSVMLKRAHGALPDAGCVVPLEFDKSIEDAIKDLARRATRAEQLFVDEYDARKAAEREIAELKARIVVLEAMKP